MSGALGALLLLLAVRVLRRWRRRAKDRARGVAAPSRRGRRRWHRRTSIVLVVGIAAMWSLLPSLIAAETQASALPLVGDCKGPPGIESPGNTSTDFFDSDAVAARGDGTAYGKYGWAGLTYQTYDLGCGPDVVRAPAAVFDTTLGNAGLAVAKWLTGFAVWMDRQNTVDKSGASPSDTVLGRIDEVVQAGSKALREVFFDPWIGVAALIVAIMVFYFAFKAAAASAMRQSVVAGLALFLAALVMGAPTSTMHEINHELDLAVGHVQGDALRKVGVDPKTGPREAIINQVIIRQWRAGYFDDPDGPLAKKLGVQLRDSLAWTWHESDYIKQVNAKFAHKSLFDQLRVVLTDPVVRKAFAMASKKRHEFEQIASATKNAGQYQKFIGKDQGRTSAGWTAALEAACVDMLWIAASLLRFIGMMIVALATLFGPVWAPAAMVSEKVLGNMVRFVGAALFWAVIAAAAVAVDLVAMTGIFTTDLPNGWKVFVMVLISAVIWMLLRPFKRLAQFAAMRVDPRQALRRGLRRRPRRYLDDFDDAPLRRRRRRSDEPESDERRDRRRRLPRPQEGIPERRAAPLNLKRQPLSSARAALQVSSPVAGQLQAGAPAAALTKTGVVKVLNGAARAGLPPARTPAALPGGVTHHALPPGRDPEDRNPGAGEPATRPRVGRVVSVDPGGRVVDVYDDVFDPAAPGPAPVRHEAGNDVYDVYTPAGLELAGARTGGAP